MRAGGAAWRFAETGQKLPRTEQECGSFPGRTEQGLMPRSNALTGIRDSAKSEGRLESGFAGSQSRNVRLELFGEVQHGGERAAANQSWPRSIEFGA